MRLISRPDGFGSVGYQMQISDFPGIDHNWLQEQNRLRRSRASAYALYDMAKAGQGDLARLRWFHDVGLKTEPSPLARAQIGAGLAAMGDRIRAHDSFLQAVQALGYRAEGDWYQSPLRDLAGVISLAYEAGETGIARGLQGHLENTVRSPDDMNTQEQAYLLRAAHGMFATARAANIRAFGVRAESATRFAVGRLADARLVNAAPGAIWRTVTVSGLPTAPPAAGGAGLHLDKRFLGLDGGAIDPGALRQGQQVIVRLSGKADSQQSMQTVIDDALPAGLEIEAVLKPVDAQGSTGGDDDQKGAPGRFAFLGKLSDASLQEKRDDRFVAAFRTQGGRPFVLAYVARAVTPGDFFLPGAEVHNMYRPAVNAHTPAGRLRIAAGQ
jgi:uncharacterized protein YfaS (alpha-2-macroglobulin family)